MPDVLLVTRHPAIGMTLQNAGIDVIDLRPHRLPGWEPSADSPPRAVVIDAHDPQNAASFVQALRDRGIDAPYLLVASDDPGWASSTLTHDARITLLTLPITLTRLVAGVQTLLNGAGPVSPVTDAPGIAAATTARAERVYAPTPVPVVPTPPPAPAPPTPPAPVVRPPAQAPPPPPPPVEKPPPAEAAPPATADVQAPPAPDPTPAQTPAPADAATAPVAEPTEATAAAEQPAAADPSAEPAEAPVAPPAASHGPASGTRSGRRRAGGRRERGPGGHARQGRHLPPPPVPAPPTPEPATAAEEPTARADAAAVPVAPDLVPARVQPEHEPQGLAEPEPADEAEPAAEFAPPDVAALSAPVIDSPAESSQTIEEPLPHVRSLLNQVNLLYSVPETAEVVIYDAVERTGAEGGALLVPDGPRWRVAAGVGLRPLEFRYEIDGGHWLVTEIARPRRGMIVRDSDIVRDRMHGAPLASWPYILAAPVPGVEAILVLARQNEPGFGEDALASLDRIAVEAEPLLRAALDVRELARRMAEFRNIDEL